MRGRVRAVSGHERLALTSWDVCAAAPGAIAGPDALPGGGWTPATVPTTAAGALRAAGAWSLDGAARRFDGEDWWWRTSVPLAPAAPGEELVLCLDGVATIADAWWNGAHVLASDDMFVAHEVPIVAAAHNDLIIRCRALDTHLAARRPRPRWKVPMIEQQQLRFARTTLLGRTPGWSPPAAAVGPWREVRIERRRGVVIEDVRLRAGVVDGSGVLAVICRARGTAAGPAPVEIVVSRGEREHRIALTANLSDGEYAGRLAIADAALWWPHTHGEPACYRARLEVAHAGGVAQVDLGSIGFREVAVDTRDGDFALSINGARVFARGACWTPIDPVTLVATPSATDDAVSQVTDCGMNMLRIGGTMVYESDAFHDACDARGVMVWQDLMFANMDYPDEDTTFVASVEREVRQQLARLAARPSTTIVCGGSEVEQQAAMWGAPRERWATRLGTEILAKLSAEALPDVPYWPSSAHGGAFPHAANAGTSSYYGVGAYLRPQGDARRSEVRFASECLAFANVPVAASKAMPGGPAARVHHPAWKARTPRDLGAGWDFDDVRDFYVEQLFGEGAMQLRYADHDRYLALGRVATGEVMAATFGEWRRARAATRGAIVWFLRDLWASAGWGVVDATGAPKAAWYYLRRALAPTALAITDEGSSGLAIHAINDRAAAVTGELSLAMFRAGEVAVGGGARAIEIPARGALELPAMSMLEHFMDLSYAYRFGPPACDLIVATLRGEGGTVIGDAFHFPVGLPRARELDVGLAAEVAHVDGETRLTVRARRFAQSVSIECEGFVPDDDFFHVAPGGARTVRLRRTSGSGGGKVRGTVTALNAEATARFEVTS